MCHFMPETILFLLTCLTVLFHGRSYDYLFVFRTPCRFSSTPSSTAAHVRTPPVSAVLVPWGVRPSTCLHCVVSIRPSGSCALVHVRLPSVTSRPSPSAWLMNWSTLPRFVTYVPACINALSITQRCPAQTEGRDIFLILAASHSIVVICWTASQQVAW